MLKYVVKRDGTTEEFIPHKLNKWGQWAAENLEGRADWSSVVLEAIKGLKESVSTIELQEHLITACINKQDWPHNLMAGRLYIPNLYKAMFGGTKPTIKELHANMEALGLMEDMRYTTEEYQVAEEIIQHSRDFNLAYFQIDHIMHKYSLQNRRTKERFETPQFTAMRMAMALSANDPSDTKMSAVKARYDAYSLRKVSSPTPSYINLGTKNKGLASCCLYVTDDTVASLATGDHIALMMTAESAGIGGLISTRSLGDQVRGGLITHQGKLPYYFSVSGAVHANTQGGRGGACTQHYSAFDPEAVVIAQLQNPKSTEDKKNRRIHFSMLCNRLLAKKVAKNESIFQFTSYSHPDLWKLMFSGDKDAFEELYNKYEEATSPKINARDFVILATQQSHEVGTHYFAFIDEINRHTPFKEPIHSSNLCQEVTLPTGAYYKVQDLYMSADNGVIQYEDFDGSTNTLPYSSKVHVPNRGGRYEYTFAGDLREGVEVKKILKNIPTSEVGICSLAAIPICNIETDEEHAESAYIALKDISSNILRSEYKMPQIGYTAKARMNAGVGIIGLAYQLAKEGVNYNSQEVFNRIHQIAERHAYFVIKASLRLSKEIGNAPWIHKTKWPEGWLPIDTYKSNVDSLVTVGLSYDWEALREEIIINGGIAHSSLIAHMPTESSSKGAGLPNGVYPVREIAMAKKDQSNVIGWVAVDNDILDYQQAWNISTMDMIKVYSIIQKFTDQAISADLYTDRTNDMNVYTEDICKEFIAMSTYGMKTRYYSVTRASFKDNTSGIVCSSGVCEV